jgi:hypothetical protein
MPWSISLGARRNGRRLAQDSSGETGEYDPNRLAAYCAENFERSEIVSLVQMLQSHLDEPAEDDELPDPAAVKRERTGLDSRLAPSRDYIDRFPNALRLKS